eukprot:376451_1
MGLTGKQIGWGFACVFSVILMMIGIVGLKDVLEFKRNSEQTTCTVSSYEHSECTYEYECNCRTDSDGNRHCSICSAPGDEYKYYGISELCDGNILSQHFIDIDSCERAPSPPPEQVGYTAKCWVSCGNAYFSFYSPHTAASWKIAMLVIGLCGFIASCFCVLGPMFNDKFDVSRHPLL